MGGKLTLKQELFVKEYLIDKNATRAAKAAGYSEHTAEKIGSENLRKPEVAAAIEDGFEAQIKDAERRAVKRGLTKERWLKELELIAFANMDDFATVDIEKRQDFMGDDEDPYEYEIQKVNLIATKNRKVGRGRVIKKLSETTTQHGGSMGIELHNKIPALEIIGKAYGWVKDSIEHSTPGGTFDVIVTLPSNGRESNK